MKYNVTCFLKAACINCKVSCHRNVAYKAACRCHSLLPRMILIVLRSGLPLSCCGSPVTRDLDMFSGLHLTHHTNFCMLVHYTAACRCYGALNVLYTRCHAYSRQYRVVVCRIPVARATVRITSAMGKKANAEPKTAAKAAAVAATA